MIDRIRGNNEEPIVDETSNEVLNLAEQLMDNEKKNDLIIEFQKGVTKGNKEDLYEFYIKQNEEFLNYVYSKTQDKLLKEKRERIDFLKQRKDKINSK